MVLKGTDQKTKTYLTNNVNRLRYGPTIRFGIGAVQLYGFYSLANLSKNISSQDIQTFNVGINLSWSYSEDYLKDIFEQLDKPKHQTTTLNF